MTDLLFVTPTFLSGVGRAIDIGAILEQTSYNRSRTPEEADERAIRGDFEVVGKDLQSAMNTVGEDAR